MHYLYTGYSGQLVYKLSEQAPGDWKDIHKIDISPAQLLNSLYVSSEEY